MDGSPRTDPVSVEGRLERYQGVQPSSPPPTPCRWRGDWKASQVRAARLPSTDPASVEGRLEGYFRFALAGSPPPTPCRWRGDWKASQVRAARLPSTDPASVEGRLWRVCL